MVPRTLRSALLAGLAVGVVGVVTATAAPAVARAATVTPTSRVIVGDVTADGRPDQVTLGSDTSGTVPACSARVRPGLATGGVGTGSFRPLPIRGTTVVACPDLGVVVTGPTPGGSRLAVTWSSLPPVGGNSVQFFRWNPTSSTWKYDGGTTGQYQPSSLASRDVDGDGFGDLVESTDQGAGVSVFTGRASTYTQLWTSAPSSSDRLSFADFDHHGGVDVLDGHGFFGFTNVGVTVVDGATGALVDLISDSSTSPATYAPQAVDLNGDGWLDIRVRVTAADGSPLPTVVFRNRATGTLAFRRL